MEEQAREHEEDKRGVDKAAERGTDSRGEVFPSRGPQDNLLEEKCTKEWALETGDTGTQGLPSSGRKWVRGAS